MTQPSLNWDADISLPVSGSTPAARHASASGAQAAAVVFGGRASKVLAAFAKFGRLTIAQASEVTGLSIQSTCSVWAKLERAGYIVGTGEFYRYQVHGREVKREWHELTELGQASTKGR